MRILSLLFITFFAFTACQNNADSSDEVTETTEEEAGPRYTLTPFTQSAGFPDAKIESMNFKDGEFSFTVGGDTYQLGAQTADAEQKMCANSGKGQHIHLIVDNMPYIAKYEASFKNELPDGEHHLLAFLSRSYHESIKTTDASVVKKVAVAGNNFSSSEEVTYPMLFYSRPKGTYTGAKDTKKVMLDFYLANVNLGDGYQVRALINGEKHMIDKWQPYYVEGLPMGENTINLALLDKEGNLVKTPLNPVTRKFTLKEDPAE